MISYLVGQPVLVENELTILCQGVGYLVHCSTKDMMSIRKDKQVSLFVETIVKEDSIELFGFLNYSDKKMFQLFLTVSGIGPRTALLLTDKKSEDLIEAVRQAQVSFFTAIPRIGKKMAQKIIIELGSKLGELKKLDLGVLDDKTSSIVDGLVSLGFEEEKVIESVKDLIDSDLTEQEIIKRVIKTMGAS